MNRVRKDTLPDGQEFIDEGCDIEPSCLSCSLPLCRYDQPSHMLSLSKQYDRDTRIVELRKAGVPVEAIRKAYGIEQRTLYRILERGGPSEAARRAMEEEDMDDAPPLRSPLNLTRLIKARRPLPKLKVTP